MKGKFKIKVNYQQQRQKMVREEENNCVSGGPGRRGIINFKGVMGGGGG
jgi:hypothetical protein